MPRNMSHGTPPIDENPDFGTPPIDEISEFGTPPIDEISEFGTPSEGYQRGCQDFAENLPLLLDRPRFTEFLFLLHFWIV